MMNIKASIIILFSIFISVAADAQKSMISINDIPPEITNFVHKHYSNFSIKSAAKDISEDKVEYEIKLNKNVELEFGADLKIKEIESKRGIASSLLHPEIAEYVKNNYTNAKITEWQLKDYGHKIELDNQLEFRFDNNGHLIK